MDSMNYEQICVVETISMALGALSRLHNRVSIHHEESRHVTIHERFLKTTWAHSFT